MQPMSNRSAAKRLLWFPLSVRVKNITIMDLCARCTAHFFSVHLDAASGAVIVAIDGNAISPDPFALSFESGLVFGVYEGVALHARPKA